MCLKIDGTTGISFIRKDCMEQPGKQQRVSNGPLDGAALLICRRVFLCF